MHRLTVGFDGRPAVDDVSFAVARGERLGIIGESGSGKSLTAAAVMGLLPPDAEARGEVLVEGTDVLALPEKRLRRLRGTAMSMVFQDPLTALNPLVTVGRQVAEPLRRAGLTRERANEEASALLGRMKLPDPGQVARAHPGRLSGGQRQRAALAMALACRPRLLIADEPTTSLDVTVQAEILRLLMEITGPEADGPGPVSLLFITHDLAVAAGLCDRLLVMRHGRIVAEGPTGAVLRSEQPYVRELMSAARATSLSVHRQGQDTAAVTPG